MATAYSSLHQAKPPRLHQPIKQKPKAKPVQIQLQPPSVLPSMPSMASALPTMSSSKQYSAEGLPPTSRTTSLAGRKRPRESDGGSGDVKIIPRRTKSVGAPTDGKARDREAFQRGLIAVFVPKALEESARGIMGNYTDLLASFLSTPLVPVPPLGPLLPLIRSLTANVNLLSPGLHGALVTAILNLPWAAAEERFVKAYIGWAGVLISAHPDWAKSVVEMAVKGLRWQTPLQSTSTPSAISRRIYHARHHLLITHLLDLIPTLPNLLAPLLVRYFPNKREREVAQTTYLRNICEVAEYCPELNTRIWDHAVDRMLRIDVEITRAGEGEGNEDEDEDDDAEEEEEEERLTAMCRASEIQGDAWNLSVLEDVPPDPIIRDRQDDGDSDDDEDGELDLDDLSSDGEDASDDETKSDAAKEALARAKKKLNLMLMRRKLDGMLIYFFRHLEESMGYRSASPPAAEFAASSLTAASSGRSTPASESPTPLVTPSIYHTPRRAPPSPAQSLASFQTLLNLFIRQILPTSATQHIPFLLFLCASFSPSHTDLFLGLLVSHSLYGGTASTSPSIPSQPVSLNQRVGATVYIGSIVCRARFVTDEQARQVMTYLLAYIEGKMQQAKLSSRVDELPLFYAVSQAVMLIFCFRWRAFLARDREDEVVGEMELEGEDGGVGDEGKWMRELEVLQRALTSELNPLLGCNPTIVQTFAKVAHQTNFAYCYSILESNASAARSSSSHSLSSLSRPAQTTFNRSISTPSASTSTTTSSSAHKGTLPFDRFRRPAAVSSASSTSISAANLAIPRIARQSNIDAGLDNYFPFDPFDLPRSGERIEALYRTWKEVAVDASGESDSDSDNEGESVSEEDTDGDDDDEDELGDSPLSDHLSPKMMMIRPGSLGKGKNGLSSSADRRRVLKDGGLSSSFDGMSISPRFSSLAGPRAAR